MLAISHIHMLPVWEDIGSAVRKIVLRSIYVSVFVFQLARTNYPGFKFGCGNGGSHLLGMVDGKALPAANPTAIDCSSSDD